MLKSASLFFKAETFGGETAEQRNCVQEETPGNYRAEGRIWSPATNRGDSQAET